MPKTKRLYHFMEAKWALQAIGNRRLKIANLDEANDLFEMLAFRWDCEGQEADFLRIRKSLMEKHGVICLSKICGNPAMWGHYADNGKGMCLGFDVDLHDDNGKELVKKVCYVPNRLDTDLSRFTSDFEEVKKLLYTKSSNWEYEEEWRLWISIVEEERDPVTNHQFFPFNGQIRLREILVGFRCEEENIKRRLEKLAAGYPSPPEITFPRPSSSAFELI